MEGINMTRDEMLRKMYFRYVNNGIAIYQPVNEGENFVFVDMNEAGLEICHLDRVEQIIGRTVTECFPGVYANGLLNALRRVHHKGGCLKLPLREYRNTVFSAWVKNIVFRIPPGEIVVIFEDVTEQHKALERDREFIARENWMLTNVLEDVSAVNDSVTGDHIHRITRYAECLAIAHDIPTGLIDGIHRYASLHDIGKVGIRSELLQAQRELTEAEKCEMHRHVTLGGDILRRNGFDRIGVDIAEYHHEQWDGQGYLKGLREREIPIEARIVAIADNYDALISPRPYKRAFSREKTEQIIMNGRGNRFDPLLIATFIRIREKFFEIYQQSKQRTNRIIAGGTDD